MACVSRQAVGLSDHEDRIGSSPFFIRRQTKLTLDVGGRGCSICAEAFSDLPGGTLVTTLPSCGHAFCEGCLGWWSEAAAKSCPDCPRLRRGGNTGRQTFT